MNDQKNISTIEVSYFNKINDKVPQQSNLFDLLEKIKQDQTYLRLVEQISSEASKEERNKLKKRLIALVPATKLKGGITQKDILEYNPIIFIDIDLDSEENARECFEKMREKFDENLIYLGYSASKKGVHMLIYIKDVDNHMEHQQAIHEDILRLGYEPDKSTLNPIQRMFLSHVNTAIINVNPRPYDKVVENEIPSKLQKAETSKVENSDGNTTSIPINNATIRKVESYVALIVEKGVDITEKRPKWIRFAYSLASLGEVGRKYFHQISQFHPNYSVDECDTIFSNCLHNYSGKGLKIGSFFHFCHIAEIKPPKRNTDREPQNETLQRYEEFLNNFKFRYNIVTSRIEIYDESINEYRPMEDRDFNSIHRRSWHNNKRIPEKSLKTILYSDYVCPFNPFLNYFNNLPIWDGVNYIGKLVSTVSTTNEDLWTRQATKWLVAMVASAIDDKIINHTVLVLVGAQGLGKTSWVEKLVPKELKKYVSSGRIQPNNKDTLIFLSECLLLFMDELAGLSKADIEDYKEIITKPSIRIRRPYGYFSENLPHRASFIASINEFDFIRDTTGSRRWLPFEVKTINYKHNINMDMVYSQAMHMFRSGFRYWLDMDEINELERHNEQFTNQTIEEQHLLHCFEPCDEDCADIFLQSGMITKHLVQSIEKLGLNNNTERNVGRALRKHKFLRLHKSQRWVFALKIRRVDENEGIERKFMEFMARDSRERFELQNEIENEVKKKLIEGKQGKDEIGDLPTFEDLLIVEKSGDDKVKS